MVDFFFHPVWLQVGLVFLVINHVLTPSGFQIKNFIVGDS